MSTATSARPDPIAVLDQGWVALIDCMGSDESIVENARRSYSDGSKRVSTDRDLIRYLVRHKYDDGPHPGPFEFAQTIWEIACPLFTFGHFVRHRTASFNVFSQRYSEVPDKFHGTKPDAWRLQATDNKQGSSGFLPVDGFDPPDFSGPFDGKSLSYYEEEHHELTRQLYGRLLSVGIARELARKVLTLSHYTQFRMRIDLKNLFGFLEQRLARTAQEETRAYAQAMATIVEQRFPLSWEAFRDYRLNAVTLSVVDQEVIGMLFRGTHIEACLPQIANNRERAECRKKLAALGLIVPEKGVTP